MTVSATSGTDEVKEKLEVLINNGLQFVKVPKDILCSSCGSIPLFHYIYPCLHPYCRDCFKNVFQKRNMKCKLCDEELGTRLLQKTSIEYDIYMLKAICPNQRYGCKDVIALNCLLEHIEVCLFTEDNQQYNLQLKEKLSHNDGSVQNFDVVSAEIRDLKMSISEMKVKIDDFTRSNQSWDNLAQFLLEENGSLKEQMRQMSLDLKRTQDCNETTTNKIKDKIKLIKIKSRQNDSNVEINVESLKLPTTISAINLQSVSKSNAEEQEPIVTGTNIPPQATIPEVMEKRFRKLENTISDVSLSQMSIRNNVDQYIRVIVAAQLLAEDEPVIRETIFKKIEENNIVTKESDLGKMIVDNQLDLKQDICLMKKFIQNNNAVIESQSVIFKNICDNNKENAEEFKRQNVINETLERKLFEIHSIKGWINKLQDARAIKDLVSRNAWNNLNFNDQAGVKSKIKEIRSLKNGTLLWQIENWEKKKKDKSTLFSEAFYSSENGFKMRIKIEFCYPSIKPSIEILPGEFDSLLSPSIHCRAILSILDQSEKRDKRDMVIVHEPPFGEETKGFLEDYYFCWLFLRGNEEKELYDRNDKIFIRAEIEPITSLFRNYFSNDGILVWNIDNYERTKRESIKRINDYIYSDYFYSSESGFRMKARVGFYNENIYFHLFFLVGEFDSKLPSYFNHRCTTSLINQKQKISSKDLVIGSEKLDSASVREKKVKTEMSFNHCPIIAISRSKVEKEPYLINDKIIVKFVVEALY